MSYVQQILQPGEQVRFAGTIHWLSYLPGFACLILALAVFILAQSGERTHGFWLAISAVLAAVAAVLMIRTWFHRWITEIAVTNRRVIYKTGFISRKTIEMHMDKVESVEVNQSILGRILDYGDVEVIGTGETKFDKIKTVAHPIELRNHITGA